MQAVNDVASAMHPTAGLQSDVRVVFTTPCTQEEDGYLTPAPVSPPDRPRAHVSGVVVVAILCVFYLLLKNHGK